MIYKYGIDFGTTNSSIAMSFDENGKLYTQVVHLKDEFPRETIPSVILIDKNGRIYAGDKAKKRYMQEGPRSKNSRYIKRIKLDLEKCGSDLQYEHNQCSFTAATLIAAILKELRLKAEKAAEENDIKISGVVMGVPVQYGDIQKNVLKQALVEAGYYKTYEEADKKTEFVSEPVAVAVHYGLNLERDTTVMVFDFGGGTLDLAIVNLKNQVGKDRLHPHKTIAKERITLGGEELTRLFFINSFCNSAKYGTKRICTEFGFNRDLTAESVWEKLQSCEEGIRFIDEIEKCKCDLAVMQTVKFSFLAAGIELEEQKFRLEDLKLAIRDKLEEIDELVDRCIVSGGLENKYDIDYVILAGGSSLTLPVQEILTDKFGSNRVNSKPITASKDSRQHARASEVLTSIVRGLSIIGCREGELVEDVVDCDYGVWDNEKNAFFPIVTKGTPVADTKVNKITFDGKSDEFSVVNKNASSVKIDVYLRNLNGEQRLGTIMINNPGGKKYKIYMQIDKKKGSLEVMIYDRIKGRWFNDIPLDERTYTI